MPRNETAQMFADVTSHLGQFVGAPGIVLIFLFLHLLSAAFFRKSAAAKPFFRTLMESAGAEMDRRLNRAGRTPQDLAVRGGVACALIALSAFVIGIAVDRVAVHAYGWVVLPPFLALNVSSMGVLRMARLVAGKLKENDAAGAAKIAQPFARDDLAKADAHTISRRALEALAIALNDSLVAPLFWFLLLGAPGVAVYVAASALADAFDRQDARHAMFGAPARTLARILDYAPSCLTAFLLSLAALFVSKSNPLRGFATALSQSARFRPAHRGLVIAAAAGALGVTLGGPIKHNDEYTAPHGWVGPKESSARLKAGDIERGAMLHFIVFLCVFAIVAGVLSLHFRFS
jgi:adenosylcobinamide-phosphate synthase